MESSQLLCGSGAGVLPAQFIECSSSDHMRQEQYEWQNLVAQNVAVLIWIKVPTDLL
ncbi:hypothetical protein [Thalassobacter stenotrophicus]|uniref:hypothetical protein n=1 Tax=Thalassobacter stenotrophicus TaxID=266809 RepID=UPI00130DB63C|nr:hypothetical protein [Thalassobacter stenotrophicus]